MCWITCWLNKGRRAPRSFTGSLAFVIAHRLSTVQNSDCIMVLEQGRIIERGTHDQLIQQQGRYYQLYTGKKVG